MSMGIDVSTASPEDIVRAMFGDDGPSEAYGIDCADLKRNGDRIEIEMSVGSVNVGVDECFAGGEILHECELNPDGADAYRSLVLVRYDGMADGLVAIADVIHTSGEYNDDDHVAYVSGTLHLVPPEHADAVVATASAVIESRRSDAVCDSLVQCLRRMEALNDDAFRSPRLQDTLRRMMRQMAKRL